MTQRNKWLLKAALSAAPALLVLAGWIWQASAAATRLSNVETDLATVQTDYQGLAKEIRNDLKQNASDHQVIQKTLGEVVGQLKMIVPPRSRAGLDGNGAVVRGGT